ncbi:MAG: hypothetical protein ABR576_04645 [Thermoanaerobaculia bacterium]
MPPVLVATLAYLGILVAVLAVGLILIARYLWATAKAIREIRDALAKVEADTRPLGGALEQVNGALAQLGAGLGSVLNWLVLADGSLGRIAKRFRSSAA